MKISFNPTFYLLLACLAAFSSRSETVAILGPGEVVHFTPEATASSAKTKARFLSEFAQF